MAHDLALVAVTTWPGTAAGLPTHCRANHVPLPRWLRPTTMTMHVHGLELRAKAICHRTLTVYHRALTTATVAARLGAVAGSPSARVEAPVASSLPP